MEMTSTSCPSPLMSCWSWICWLPCWRRNTQESTIIVAFTFCRRRTRKNGLTFLLKDWVLWVGEGYFLFPLILYRETLWQGWMHLNNDENLFLLPYCSYPFAWPCDAQLQLNIARLVQIGFLILLRHLIQSNYRFLESIKIFKSI